MYLHDTHTHTHTIVNPHCSMDTCRLAPAVVWRDPWQGAAARPAGPAGGQQRAARLLRQVWPGRCLLYASAGVCSVRLVVCVFRARTHPHADRCVSTYAHHVVLQHTHVARTCSTKHMYAKRMPHQLCSKLLAYIWLSELQARLRRAGARVDCFATQPGCVQQTPRATLLIPHTQRPFPAVHMHVCRPSISECESCWLNTPLHSSMCHAYSMLVCMPHARKPIARPSLKYTVHPAPRTGMWPAA